MMMNPTLHINSFSFGLLDAIALGWFLTAWFGYSAYAHASRHRTANLISLTAKLRSQWMGRVALRQYRIVDASLIGNLMRSITFFANTSIFILFGLITILGYRDEALNVIRAFPFADVGSEAMWELKIFLMAVMFAFAFFKYTWSLRLYNYASIFVGAAPEPEYFHKHPKKVEAYAKQGGHLIANAGRHFNIGLRASYFGLAVLSWFLHPIMFMVAIAWVVTEIHRREFRSRAVRDLKAVVELMG
jgi:uncharacterized membrane protein